jgi:predicted nucleic acid-binding Zn ribbon protein
MPERLAKILEGWVDGAGETIKMCGLLPLWRRVVDERVSSRTEPIKIKDRTLYVSTASPAWAQELNFLKKEIIVKFNHLAGQEVINNIKFKSGGYHG